MWPIYFVVAWYVVIFLFLATAAYVCVSVVAGLNQLGKRLFMAILAFGGSALVGCYIAAGVVSYLRIGTKAIVEPNRVVIAVAYVVPGLIGSWASWKSFKPST
jgi:hypothetical protein